MSRWSEVAERSMWWEEGKRNANANAGGELKRSVKVGEAAAKTRKPLGVPPKVKSQSPHLPKATLL